MSANEIAAKVQELREPRAQVERPEGAEMWWYLPDLDSLGAWIGAGNLDTCIQGVLTLD